MAVKKAKTSNKKLTLKKATELLERFVELREEGQIHLNCCDAEDFESDVEDALNHQKTYSCIYLGIDLKDVKLPPGADPYDTSNYEITIKVNKKIVKPSYTDVSDVDD